MKKNSFLYGTLLLIIVNFIVRFLGFAYKIIMSRLIGPEGIGLFHLVHPILMVFITFTTAGIPVAVSKLVAHYLSLNNKRGCNKVLGLSLFLGTIISTFMSFALFYFAKYISISILKSPDSYGNIIALIPAIPLITISSILRGYYYGLKDVGPPGMAQVLEQIFRVAFVVGLLFILKPQTSIHASTIAILGISFGEFVGLLWLLLKFKYIEALKLRKSYHILLDGSLSILGKIIYISVPITLSRMISVIMQSLNAVLIPQRLQVIGYSSQEALSVFGKLTGMAMPLLFLPFIVTSALVVNIIPNVSEEMVHKNWREIGMKSSLAVRMTLLVSIPLTALFIFFANPICKFIYAQDEVGKYLSLLAYSMIFLSLHHTISGILHGMGKQVMTTIHYLIGTALQLACTYYLVANPRFGVNGFIIGFILANFSMFALDYSGLCRTIKLKLNVINAFFKPLFATIIMILFMVNIFQLLTLTPMHITLRLMISIIGGLLSYIATIFCTGSIHWRTIQYLFKKKNS
ncbi:stage V sporulation protein B [Anaerosolibacter carboniphilus]|uniref:Stage V sporulation protein B n=1 Tax=Anaerosolibacter carboniphilus TaxID=1417629 RepID=A0A841KXM4_9FIRM|nr:stage V sporulation protein B [Anaerosolibacter carboniphilus]MBB6215682.1 stage V sporulation protein B [Anaerosolibacter carboniphilus]